MKLWSSRIFFVLVLLGSFAVASPAFAADETAPAVNAKVNSVAVSTASTAAQTERKRTIEEVNTLIIDSYRTRLDGVLADLYKNINKASKGNKKAQVAALSKVRDDLDVSLDALSESQVSPNRKKILLGVYFYLKTNIEDKIREIEESE